MFFDLLSTRLSTLEAQILLCDKQLQAELNKSNRTMMRPLGIYLIGISIYVLNMIHFMMISGDFCVFLNAIRETDGRTDKRMDRPSYRDGRTHLKKGVLIEKKHAYRVACT